ncbi:hypothetical protein GCM10028778_16740 [Barrientosiimonas marina]|uniref:DUF3784 domain-containing protein n=1 Tax=Lentibacillus kimchii TaxID=1542911 RepID=A0ABW2UTV4_9BACI
MNLFIGILIGAFLIWAGYMVQAKKVFSFLADVTQMWEPVNKTRLGNRVGVLLIMIGVIAILAAIVTPWFGAAAGIVSGILAGIGAIMIIIAIGLDQMGY